MAEPGHDTNCGLKKVFVYGTLKSNQPNHYVLQTGGAYFEELQYKSENKIDFQPAKFIAKAETVEKYPLVIASKFNIPYLLDKPGLGYNIQGEIYEVSEILIEILDDFEGHPSYYKRREEAVNVMQPEIGNVGKELVWTYFMPKFKPEMLELQFLSDYR